MIETSTHDAEDGPTIGEPDKPEHANGPTSVWRSDLFRRSVSPLVFLAVFVVIRVWSGEAFLRPASRSLDVHQNVPVLLLGLAAMVTLVAGFFDLSIAAMATLTTFLTIGLRSNEGWPMPVVIATCLLIGLAGGVLNGVLVVRVQINTFIATLGTAGIFTGLSAAYSGGTQLTPGIDEPQLPSWFASLASFGHKVPAWLMWVVFLLAVGGAARAGWRAARSAARPIVVTGVAIVGLIVVGELADVRTWMRSITWLTFFLLVVAALLWTLMNRTSFGRHLYATGSNSTAARIAGVPVQRESMKAFVLGGFLAALAGVLLAASQGSAAQGAANGSLLPAFAAAFLSTVIFSLGQFTVWGTVVGGTFLIWVSQGLIFGGVKFTWTAVVNGLVLLVAVSFSTLSRRARS